MKHTSYSIANGLHTPPCGTSRCKSSNFILTSLLVFLMTFMGSVNAWGSTNYFTPGKTIYFHVSGDCKNWGSNQFAVLFYYQNNENKAYGYENESYSARQFIGNSSIGSSNRIKCTKINDDYYSVVVPTNGTANIGYVRLIHLNTDDGWSHQANKKVSADSFTGTNNCVAFSGWDDADPTGYEAYNSGECITSACGSGGGGDPEPDPDPEPEPEYDYTFTRGETMYFDLRNAAWYDGGACLYAEFFTENTSRGESSQLSETGTSHVYSFQIPNRNDITKIVINRYSPDNGGHAYKWGYTADMTAEAAGSNNCIYMPSWTGNPVSCNWTKFSPYSLIGDYWLKNTNNDAGWFSPGDGPRFAYEGNGIYTLSYLVNVQAPRFTLVNHTTEVTDDKRDNTNSTSGFYNDFGSKKYKFNKITGTKKVTLTYTSSTDKLAAVYDNYDEKYTGWKLFVDGESALDMSDSGEKMVYLASGDHTFYITDGNATSYYGVNKFGGMYLSTSYTNHGVTITFPTQQYYDSNPASEHKFNIESSNYPTYPITGLRNPAAKFSLSAAANVTFSFDGGTITLDAVAPAAPHTVTIHPDPENWEYAFPLVVPDGNTINSINASYGNLTNANWFTNAACTPGNEFILGTSTVDADMDLYAKWGVEGDFYLVGDFGMHDYETNWAYNSGMAMETEDGVASVTFIAPKGCNRFEILTERSSWPAIANQGSALIAPSTPTLHWGNGYGPDGYSHFYFELDAPKKVTVRYNGKVSITAEDYDVVKDGWTVVCQNLFGLGNVANDNVDNADNANYMSGYNMTAGEMDDNGELIIRDVAIGTYKFWIGKHNTALDKTKQQIEVFGAAHVDIDNSSLGTYGSLASENNPAFHRSIPQDNRLYRRVTFSLTQKADIKIAFDGGKITVNVLPTYTVSFNSNGGSAVASQTVFEGNVASVPNPAPSRPGYTFQGWKLNDNAYNFSTPVTGDITLVAAWSANPLPEGSLYVFGAGGTNWVTGWSSHIIEDYRMDVANGEATKTFYNVSGAGLEFKIRNFTDGVLNSNNYQDFTNVLVTPLAEDNNRLMTRVWANGETNIDFSIKSGSSANVTVHFNGHEIWLTAVEVFTVTFDTDGGTTIDPQYVEINQNAIEPSNPTKEGYRFAGWDWDFDDPVTQNMTINAQFVEQVTVTFMSNGAMFAERTIDKSSNVTALEEPTVPAKAFDGWWTDADGGTQVNIATQVFDANTTLYAHWVDDPTYLQQLVDATENSGTLSLTDNFPGCDVVINKPITINGGGYSIGNLTVENAGDLTLGSALTVNDFTICAKAGNTSTPAESGQVRSANNLTVGGNAYFLYTVDPSGQVRYGWYDFTVPFPVNVMTGIAGIQNSVLNEDFVNERDYAIMEFLGDKQAEGQYPYKKFRSVMQPNKLYSITLDDDYNYNTIRFQKTNDGALVASNSVTLNAYAGIGTYDNWNGVGNGTLHHADAGVSAEFIQVYQSGDKSFLAVEKANYSLITGSAFLVQETGTMTLNQADGSHPLLAPSRETPVQPAVIQIAPEGKPFSDQLFISADEMAGSVYTQGVDLAKGGEFGKATVPQIGTNAYNTLLCVHAAQLINEKAQYDLSLYAPVNGTYTLTANRIPEDKTLYLTFNGRAIWNLSMAETYELDLNKGITTEYGLLLVETHNAPTDMEIVNSEELTVKSQKVLRNGILYILRNGEVFDAQGARVQ